MEVEQEEARAPAAQTQANIKASEVSGETSVMEETSVESLHLVDSSDD